MFLSLASLKTCKKKRSNFTPLLSMWKTTNHTLKWKTTVWHWKVTKYLLCIVWGVVSLVNLTLAMTMCCNFTLKVHPYIVYQNRNFFIPKIIVVFRTDLHKMKINTKLQKIRFFDKKDQKLSLSELLSRITRIQIYSYDLLCEPVLSMHTV